MSASRRSSLALLLIVACTASDPMPEQTTAADSSGGSDDAGSVTNLTITVNPTTGGTGDNPEPDGTSTDSGDTASDSPGSDDDPADSSDSATTAVDGPAVDSISPVEFASGVDPRPEVAVTFTQAMDPRSLSTTTDDETCSGTLQLSADDFATCVPMESAPATDDALTFRVTPAQSMLSATAYRVRVLGSVTSERGVQMGRDYTADAGFTTRYFHTIEIDGVNDFAPSEALPTSTGDPHVGYIAWDDTTVTFALSSPDVAASNGQVWWVVYLGGSDGTNDGATYNTQQPTIPFEAQTHLRWRTDAAFTGVLQWDGATWSEPEWTINPGDVFHTEAFVELRVARAELGDPDVLPVHMGLLRETVLDEASWAAVPSDSYVDGYDPDFTAYFEFDLNGSTLPGQYATSP